MTKRKYTTDGRPIIDVYQDGTPWSGNVVRLDTPDYGNRSGLTPTDALYFIKTHYSIKPSLNCDDASVCGQLKQFIRRGVKNAFPKGAKA